MSKFNKCSKCSREYIWFSCPNGCNQPLTSKKEIVQEVLSKIPIKETKPKIPKPKATKEILPLVSWDKEPKTGLPLYTRSHLHNKLNINIKSIDNKAILFWDKYILNKDIVEWYKKNILGY